MPESLNDASAEQYVSVHETLKIPIFFIEYKKFELPFIYEDITYKTAPKINSANFTIGYLNKY
ncbi:hypothetical protein D6T70_04785 [Kurthia gibsonii]|uniref:hypothetical protein n=1 Tax=Kurthia gibsonii TaxID=33946 RepID=UPI000B3EEF43|nr:hypothetical protein [Kurthia gibsonii]MCA9725322.1 hypothetical protein [Kurthia sp.]RXH52564.1 hypothetical protein D6T70_04785 [Kurthia gibsonii]HZG11549.1 hypothetical protein [Kurthia gibsonii]